jgi:hypothetical protein
MKHSSIHQKGILQLYRFVILSLLLILSGCGAKSGRHNELPAIPDKEMAGKIVVVESVVSSA